MMKKSKKGLSQVDWIISLTLFMFYLVWFFTYAVPSIAPDTEQATSFDEVYNNMQAETEWNITKLPLIFISNISGGNEILYLDFPYDSWNKSAIGFADQRDFALDEGKIFFIGNISNASNYFNIYHSDSNYTISQEPGDIVSTSAQTTINSMSMKAEFSDSKLVRLQRESDIPIDNMSFYINGIPLVSSTNILSLTNISAKYTSAAQVANLSTYLFSKNYRIIFFAYDNTIANTKNNLTFSATMRAYPYYFAHNEFSGDISYLTSECRTAYYSSISFYGNTSGTTFLLPDNSKIVFCTMNNSFTLNITMNLTNATFQIIPYIGNYNNSLKYQSPYAAQAGAHDILTGLSAGKLSALNSSSYRGKRSAWNYRGTGDFTITVTNSSNNALLDFGTAPPEGVNAYVSEKNWWILDKNGNQEKAVVNIRVW